MKIYLIVSDEEVIVDFVQDHEKLYNKPMRMTRPERIACGKDSQAAKTSL